MPEVHRDPRVRSETTYWIECTICGPDADPPPPRYWSEDDLWASLLRWDDSGWTRRDDGRILCNVHRQLARCEAEGHLEMRWTEHPLDDEMDWRYCPRCGGQFEQRIIRAQPSACRERLSESGRS